jgi:PAS domain S-box-containing protein
MQKKLTTQQQLIADNAMLRDRLEQAEQTLNEIFSGEADALMIPGGNGAQLFTLQGTDQAYRLLIEEMSEGALTTTTEGVILYANRRFAEMLKTPLEKVIGSDIYGWIAPDSQHQLQQMLHHKNEKTRHHAEVTLLASDETQIPCYLSINLLQMKESPQQICMVATDLTEQKQLDAAIATEKLSQEMLTAANRSRQVLLSVIEDQKRSETALARANRALTTLSAGNLALVRATSEDELLQTITGIIVGQAGYILAVVDYAEDGPEKRIAPKAWSGYEDDHYWAENLSWADTENGQLPIAKAIRSGETQVCHDIASDPAFRPWRESTRRLGYISNIALPLFDGSDPFGGLSIYSSDADAFDDAEIQLLEELASDLAYGIINLRTHKKHEQHEITLRQSLEQSIQTIAATVEARDPYTAGHQRRTAELAVAIAQEMGLPKSQVNGIHLASIIHDLGKVRVPSEILSKPGKLTEFEFQMIKEHPQSGYDILKEVEFPWPIANIILQHHERLNGTGYPQGLKGEQILLEAKILAVADVMEAMSSHRPYRAALGLQPALEEIRRGRDHEYDPVVADACLKLFTEKAFTFSKP